MARNMYGATSADFTVTAGGRPVAGAVLTVWTARTGGTQITDLLDADSVACTTVTSGADGSVVFYGVDGSSATVWADSGQGSRVAVRPVDITGETGATPALTIGTVDTGAAAATITGTDEDPVLNLTIPPAANDSITAAMIAADAVGSSEIAANAVGSSELADNAVDTAALQDGAVTSAKIADGTIVSGDVAAGTFAAFGTVGNLLTANQASIETDTTGFTGAGGWTVSRVASGGYHGSAFLRITATDAAGSGNIGGAGTDAIPVIGGEVYTARAMVKVSVAGTPTWGLYLVWFDAAGAYISEQYVGGSTTSKPATWTERRGVAVAPSTAAFVQCKLNGTGATADDTFDLDGLGFWRGAGGTWQLPGVPIPGQSRIAVNGAVDLSGTGTPEGVIAAAPGSTWLQTDSTTDVKGWIKWVKATGTGNTGWVAGPEADTGWRDVTASLSSAGTTKYPNLKAAIRRFGKQVEAIVYTGASSVDGATSTIIYSIPTGFKSKALWTYRSPTGAMINAANGTPATAVGLYVGSGESITIGQTATAGVGSSVVGSMTWSTEQAWPTSLPGSAV